MRTQTVASLFAAPLLVALGVAACGSDNGDADGSEVGGPDATRRDGGGADGSTLTPQDGGGTETRTDAATPVTGFGKALKFGGTQSGDIDRVKIRIDDPGVTGKVWAMDVGAADFTAEFWVKGTTADNTAPAVTCGPSAAWITGNHLLDRDRFNKPRKWGVTLGAGKVAFGVTAENASFDRTICGTKSVLDGEWHHVAVQRRRSDGFLWIFVDGAIDAEFDGPDGDVSYPDGETPANANDPFLVIGAEKYDTDKATYPPFKGLFDELRVSATLRYAAAFTRPSGPFSTDSSTVGLYHFDEGSGAVANDASGATGGPSHGEVKVGGTPASPTWVDH